MLAAEDSGVNGLRVAAAGIPDGGKFHLSFAVANNADEGQSLQIVVANAGSDDSALSGYEYVDADSDDLVETQPKVMDERVRDISPEVTRTLEHVDLALDSSSCCYKTCREEVRRPMPALRLPFVVTGLLSVLLGLLCASAPAEDTMLLDFEIADIELQDASVEQSQTAAGSALRVETGREAEMPGIALKAPEGEWDLSTHEHVAVDVRNLAESPVTVCCRVENAGADGEKFHVDASLTLEPTTSGTLNVHLNRSPWRFDHPVEFPRMQTPPDLSDAVNGRIDPAHVSAVRIFVPSPVASHVFEIRNIRAGGKYDGPKPEPFFPFIDEFGQYRHRDWPGKTHSVEDLHARRVEEAAELAQHLGPLGWNKYGGWEDGPQLRATGFFRLEKHQGKCWFVDPEGRLFWSIGPNCVNTGWADTRVEGREHFFERLPAVESPLAHFYRRRGRWFNLAGANLLRKYGDEWQEEYAGICHRRLRSWGMNTVASWSDASIYLARRTPYVVAIYFDAPSIEGPADRRRRHQAGRGIPDVFDPEFQAALRDRLAAEEGKSAGDPWCIGYFVHNELRWGHTDTALARGVFASPADQPAKQAFVQDLKAKYRTIEALNETWGTAFASWNALQQNRSAEIPDPGKAEDDLATFTSRFAERYFRMCRDAVKAAAPNQLYLGCRFQAQNYSPVIVAAAAKYGDAVSFNIYWYVPDGFAHRCPEGFDSPVVMGEFTFNSPDAGFAVNPWWLPEVTGDRGKAYKDYVKSALKHPQIVGAHWFQYGDEATTGRGDGENAQVGLVDVCDTPYAELVRASREVGYSMYEYRLGRAKQKEDDSP